MASSPQTMLELSPIKLSTTPESLDRTDDNVKTILSMTHELYARVGFQEPWIGYLAMEDDSIIGCCGFTGPPSAGSVEIAYFTFPPYEGQGFATQMCRRLTGMATMHDSKLSVRARTLKERNASTHILEKSGFILLGVVSDAGDGEVWEWEYQRE